MESQTRRITWNIEWNKIFDNVFDFLTLIMKKVLKETKDISVVDIFKNIVHKSVIFGDENDYYSSKSGFFLHAEDLNQKYLVL